MTQLFHILPGFLTISILLIINNDLNLDLLSLKNNDFVWLFILGTICTAYAFVISVEVMKHLTPYSVMLSINMEPVYGIFSWSSPSPKRAKTVFLSLFNLLISSKSSFWVVLSANLCSSEYIPTSSQAFLLFLT